MSEWYTIRFPEHEPLEEIERAIEAEFGGLCIAYRGNEDRVVHIRPHENTEEIVREQFKLFVEEGYLLSFEKRT